VRHTDARRLAQSGAGEDDRHAAAELAEPRGHLVRRDPDGARKRFFWIVVATDVDEECSPGDERPRRRPIDPHGRRTKAGSGAPCPGEAQAAFAHRRGFVRA
jgi:hypothetical protein